jgi:hypothetical protein
MHLLLLTLLPFAFAQTGPALPADPYTPLHSGELYDTAHVLQKGTKQMRLFTQSHWGLSDKLQLDVRLVRTLWAPNVGFEYLALDSDGFDLSVTANVESNWKGTAPKGYGLITTSTKVGNHDRINIGAGFGGGKVEELTFAKANKEPKINPYRTLPVRISFDKVKSDRRMTRYYIKADAGGALLDQDIQAEAGANVSYGWEKFRITAGGGLIYFPAINDVLAQFNAARGQPGESNFPRWLPQPDLNLWWVF